MAKMHHIVCECSATHIHTNGPIPSLQTFLHYLIPRSISVASSPDPTLAHIDCLFLFLLPPPQTPH